MIELTREFHHFIDSHFSRIATAIPGRYLAPTCDEGFHGRQTRAGEPVHRVMLAREGVGGNHRSFSVLSPASASTKLMIQKRITTVGSDQPRCSKWWWIGAIRKTRLPVRL